MTTIGIVLDVPTIRRLRAHMHDLSEKLTLQLNRTDANIDEISRTWRDENFIAFKRRFDEDKGKLRPLATKISDFEEGYLKEIERRLMIYLNRH